MKMIFLVDGENNIGTGLKGIDLLSKQDTVLIFYQKGLPLSKLQKLCAGSSANIQYIESVRGGKNAVDFQIITELGVLIGRQEADYAYVISQDKGYAASIQALRARYANAFQEVALRPSIESCLPLPFIFQAKDRQDLCNALVKEFGSAQGCALYKHLKKIFQAPEPNVVEKALKAAARPHRGDRKAERSERAEKAKKPKKLKKGRKSKKEREKQEEKTKKGHGVPTPQPLCAGTGNPKKFLAGRPLRRPFCRTVDRGTALFSGNLTAFSTVPPIPQILFDIIHLLLSSFLPLCKESVMMFMYIWQAFPGFTSVPPQILTLLWRLPI